ncbi:MAG: hypothetical protein ABIG31_04345 [Candidatus Omnitrophota bacterium]
MNRSNMLAWALLLSLSLFVIFNYMPSMIELSALENERFVFSQLEDKVKELEEKFVSPDVTVRAKSIAVRKQLEKQILAPETTKRKTEGNRGYLIKDGKPR